jgi:plasmid stabilization system protein ParE
MRYLVRFTSRAEDQLDELDAYLSERFSAQTAARYVDGIVDHCESLATFPLRGVLRDDVRPGLRITNFRKRVAIAFDVEGDHVTILGIFYGGQNYETSLLDDESE